MIARQCPALRVLRLGGTPSSNAVAETALLSLLPTLPALVRGHQWQRKPWCSVNTGLVVGAVNCHWAVLRTLAQPQPSSQPSGHPGAAGLE